MPDDVSARDRLVGRVAFHVPHLDPEYVTFVDVNREQVWTGDGAYKYADGSVSVVRRGPDGSVSVTRYRAGRVVSMTRNGPGSYVVAGAVRPELN